MSLTTILKIAAPQDGVFHALQASLHGVSRRQLHRMVAQGVIRRVHPAVFVLTAVPWTPQAAIRAAAVAGGGCAVAGMTSAEVLLGLAVAPAGRPEIIMGGSVAPVLDGVRVHRSRSLQAQDLTVIRGIPTTSGSRTLIDLAARRTVAERIDSVDRAICAGVVSRPRLHERAQALRCGRRGVQTLVDITAPEADGVFWSKLERTFGRGIRSSGLPLPQYNVALRHKGRLIVPDALWPEHSVVVELHGLQFHTRHDDRLRDDERLNLFAHLRLRPLVFTWRQVTEDMPGVIQELRSVLGVWV